MKNKIFILFSAILLLSLSFVLADTGTYVIEKQVTNLTIQTDRNVVIEYYMKWKVTGGNIPWVTVGLPSSNYDIIDFGGNAENVKSYNGGGWSGVYVTLDNTYYQNDEFEFTFRVTQKNFIQKYEDKASIQFTPTWWDNAPIEDLIVRIILPNEISSIEASSEPSRYENGSAVWEWTNVNKGERKTVGALMDVNAFPGLNETISTAGDFAANTGTDTSPKPFIWVIFGAIVLFFASKAIFNNYDSPSVHASSKHSSTRHINMLCPNDNAPLDKRTLKETTIDFCDICGGTFFDKGEIESLIKAGINEKEFNKNDKKTFAEPKKIITKCPRCEGVMNKKERNKDGVSATLFICEDCDGIWLNKGTYQTIKDKRLEQEKEAKKKKDEDKDYFPLAWWLFYPHIGSTGAMSHSTVAHFGGGSFGGGGSSSGSTSSVVSSCACVSCACVSACAYVLFVILNGIDLQKNK